MRLMKVVMTAPQGSLQRMIQQNEYTPKGESAEQKIRADLEKLVNEFRLIVDGTYILTGSFGRGEGSVRKTDTGVQPVNDYDFVVVPEEQNKTDLKSTLASKANKLAEKLSIDFVDVMIVDQSELSSLDPSIFNYDLRYGSVVVHGDPDILSKIPTFSPGDIPLYEAIILLSNRMAGVLGGLVSEKSNRYLWNQIQKLRLAWADSLLLTQAIYCSSYREKTERCISLLTDGLLSGISENIAIADDIADAITFKLDPKYEQAANQSEVENCLRRTHTVFQTVIETLTHSSCNSPWDAYRRLVSYKWEPHIRLWNAYRLWSSDNIGVIRVARLLPGCSESQIRVSIALGLHRLVTERTPMEPPLFYRELFSGEMPTPAESGEKLYEVWNTLFH